MFFANGSVRFAIVGGREAGSESTKVQKTKTLGQRFWNQNFDEGEAHKMDGPIGKRHVRVLINSKNHILRPSAMVRLVGVLSTSAFQINLGYFGFF